MNRQNYPSIWSISVGDASRTTPQFGWAVRLGSSLKPHRRSLSPHFSKLAGWAESKPAVLGTFTFGYLLGFYCLFKIKFPSLEIGNWLLLIFWKIEAEKCWCRSILLARCFASISNGNSCLSMVFCAHLQYLYPHWSLMKTSWDLVSDNGSHRLQSRPDIPLD